MKHILFIIIGFNLLWSCKPSKEQMVFTQSNFIVVVDLSDRLLDENQKQRDIEIIETIFSSLKNEIRQKMYVNSEDAFHFRIAHQAKSKINTLEYENLLSINMKALSVFDKKNSVDEFESNLNTTLNSLYTDALTGNNSSKDFSGADIWSFFKDDLNGLCSADSNTNNYVFIITDGYLHFNDNQNKKSVGNRYPNFSFLSKVRKADSRWSAVFNQEDYGLIPAGKVSSPFKTMVLEVNPKDDFMYEFDLLSEIWGKWLDEENSQDFQVVKKEAIQSIKNRINNFIEGDNVVRTAKSNEIENNKFIVSNNEPLKLNSGKYFGLYVTPGNDSLPATLQVLSVSENQFTYNFFVNIELMVNNYQGFINDNHLNFEPSETNSLQMNLIRNFGKPVIYQNSLGKLVIQSNSLQLIESL